MQEKGGGTKRDVGPDLHERIQVAYPRAVGEGPGRAYSLTPGLQ